MAGHRKRSPDRIGRDFGAMQRGLAPFTTRDVADPDFRSSLLHSLPARPFSVVRAGSSVDHPGQAGLFGRAVRADCPVVHPGHVGHSVVGSFPYRLPRISPPNLQCVVAHNAILINLQRLRCRGVRGGWGERLYFLVRNGLRGDWCERRYWRIVNSVNHDSLRRTQGATKTKASTIAGLRGSAWVITFAMCPSCHLPPSSGRRFQLRSSHQKGAPSA